MQDGCVTACKTGPSVTPVNRTPPTRGLTVGAGAVTAPQRGARLVPAMDELFAGLSNMLPGVSAMGAGGGFAGDAFKDDAASPPPGPRCVPPPPGPEACRWTANARAQRAGAHGGGWRGEDSTATTRALTSPHPAAGRRRGLRLLRAAAPSVTHASARGARARVALGFSLCASVAARLAPRAHARPSLAAMSTVSSVGTPGRAGAEALNALALHGPGAVPRQPKVVVSAELAKYIGTSFTRGYTALHKLCSQLGVLPSSLEVRLPCPGCV